MTTKETDWINTRMGSAEGGIMLVHRITGEKRQVGIKEYLGSDYAAFEAIHKRNLAREAAKIRKAGKPSEDSAQGKSRDKTVSAALAWAKKQELKLWAYWQAEIGARL